MNHQQAKQYFDKLTTLALRIVGAVHDESHEAIRTALVEARILRPPNGVDTDTALAITLAALVNPNSRRSELLAHLTHLDYGLADLYPGHQPGPEHYRCNPIAVEMAVEGRLPAAALNPAELIRTTVILASRGLNADDIADHLEANRRDVIAWARAGRATKADAA